MIATFRHQRNRLGFRLWTLALALCWLALMLSVNCQMSMTQTESAVGMADCAGMEGMNGTAPQPDEPSRIDCGIKLCVQALPDTVADVQISPPIIVWSVLFFLADRIVVRRNTLRRLPPMPTGPPGRPIPLFYRYCSLRD